MAIVVNSSDPGAFRRQRNAPNYRAWQRAGFRMPGHRGNASRNAPIYDGADWSTDDWLGSFWWAKNAVFAKSKNPGQK